MAVTTVTRRVHLRMTGHLRGGGSKDWICIITEAGLEIHSGTTGTKLKVSKVRPQKCKTWNPWIEGQERIREKVNKGYQVLADDTEHPKPEPPESAPPTTAPPKTKAPQPSPNIWGNAAKRFIL